MKVDRIYERVSITLQDRSQNRWVWSDNGTDLVLEPLLNQAIEAVVAARPDATAITEPQKLGAGSKQTVPSDTYQLIEITRNMGSDGKTPGNFIYQVNRNIMDRFDADWSALSGQKEIQCYAYNMFFNRQVFWVFPPVPADSAIYVEMTRAQMPGQIANTGVEFPLPDIFADPVFHHILFQIFTGDSEDANFDRGMKHLEIFNQKLNVKNRSDVTYYTGQLTQTTRDEG